MKTRGRKTTIHGIEVPLPMNNGRGPRGPIHRVMSHGAVIICELDRTSNLARSKMKRKDRVKVIFLCADLGRDRISSLLLFEPAREPRVTCVADSGWKPTGTAV